MGKWVCSLCNAQMVYACLCVCVRLFRLTGVPSLQGPVIKPLCTQPQSLAYIYHLHKIHGGFVHTCTHTQTHSQTAFPYRMWCNAPAGLALYVIRRSSFFFFLHVYIYLIVVSNGFAYHACVKFEWHVSLKPWLVCFFWLKCGSQIR